MFQHNAFQYNGFQTGYVVAVEPPEREAGNAFQYSGFQFNGFSVPYFKQQQSTGGWIPSPIERTKEQVEAERVRLGIIEAKKEVKRIVRLLTEKRKEQATQIEIAKLHTHEYLLKQQLDEARRAYDALLFRINSNALQQRLIEQQLLNEVLQDEALRIAEEEAIAQILAEQERLRQQEEEDIVFVMSMLAVM